MKTIEKLNSITDLSKRKEFVIKNKVALLQEKRSIIKNNVKTLSVTQSFIKKLGIATKSNDDYNLEEGEAIVNFIGNTYLWLDNHEDVHDKSVFKKTIKERKNKIWHLADHKYGVLAKLGDIQDIQEIKVNWRDLNIDKDGETEILLITSKISKERNPAIYKEYVSKKANQHSVGMWYVNISLAIDEGNEKEEYKIWVQYIDKLGNKEKAEELGYFFLIKEAGLREVSYVLESSNEITHTVEIVEQKDDKKEKEKAILRFLNS